MKKFLSFIFLTVLFLSCTDIGNSPLKGKWQLKTVERNGVVNQVDTVWYNFQSESLFSLQIYLVGEDKYVQTYGFRAERGNVLEIELLDGNHLKSSDWTDVKRTFTVDKCKKNSLVLVSEENYIYGFEKF